jgi:hypothetical protein
MIPKDDPANMATGFHTQVKVLIFFQFPFIFMPYLFYF